MFWTRGQRSQTCTRRSNYVFSPEETVWGFSREQLLECRVPNDSGELIYTYLIGLSLALYQLVQELV